MPLVKEVIHQYEINPLACGQAVLSMISNVSINDVISYVKTEKETTLKDMKSFLKNHSIKLAEERKQAFSISDLPPLAMLSLETPKCWHWSLYFKGKVYDPEYGALTDFPVCDRKYYWEICEE